MRILTAALGAALGTAILVAPPASAEQVKNNCEGTEVVRCANVEMSSPGVFNAHARVTDAANGNDYSVQVIEVRLQYNYNGSWLNLRDEFPADSWAAVQDVERTTSWSCGSSARKLVRAQTYVQWRRSGTVTGDWVTTPSVYICPRS
ncbi:hypothetical protein [Promicromonospora iranensis]|uniref:hypothetical protein n=1 Tax=Promicromonospora iranensis TaxID=1105144 RepID=UPI0023A977E1|nr:hypothetical protein [Promicromonospora iranensis]